MDFPSSAAELLESQAITVLLSLLPGLLTAAIVSMLTVRRKHSVFERVIEALIYTFLCYVLWTFVAASINAWLSLLGFRALPSSKPAALLGLFASAVVLGVLATYVVNSGRVHSWLSHKRVRLTKRSSHPSEWYEAFWRYEAFVVLHLHDGRRLYGWPLLWPEHSKQGHFVVSDASWLDSDEHKDIRTTMLVPSVDVRFVEFVFTDSKREAANESPKSS